jgi:hypothetical protein
MTDRHAAGPWGPWRFDARRRVLDHDWYEIDLDRCTSSAEVLDWICQVAGKSWADDATIAGLVRALDDVLAPQQYLCGFGLEAGPINVKTVLRQTAEARRERRRTERAIDAYVAAERKRRGDPGAIVAVPLELYLGREAAAS